MKQLASTINNDFFYITKTWLTDVDANMRIKKNGKIEIKYYDGNIYIAYPLDCTYEQAEQDIQFLITSAGIAVDDNNIFIIKRLNELLADTYEYAFDPITKGSV